MSTLIKVVFHREHRTTGFSNYEVETGHKMVSISSDQSIGLHLRDRLRKHRDKLAC